MKARLYIVLCIAFITQMAGVLPLQAGHYYYKQISLKEGLPSTVRCILTDEQGFVWIGTRSGLGRFDGHELKKYIHHADDPHSLPHDLVLQIAEDEQYNIWILTDKGWHATNGKVTTSTCQPTKKERTSPHIPPALPQRVIIRSQKQNLLLQLPGRFFPPAAGIRPDTGFQKLQYHDTQPLG